MQKEVEPAADIVGLAGGFVIVTSSLDLGLSQPLLLI